MTTERLQELVDLCDNATNKVWRAYDLYEISRYLKAWLKLENLLTDHPGSSVDLVLGRKAIICNNVIMKTTGRSALEVIEAIKEE